MIAHLVGLPYWWDKSPLMTIFLVIFGYWLLINVIFHYYMAVFTSPGYPPEVNHMFYVLCVKKTLQFVISAEFSHDFYSVCIGFCLSFVKQFSSSSKERLYEAVSICKKCLTPKPTRTHHCSICNKCILKMDHHCPWYVICLVWMNVDSKQSISKIIFTIFLAIRLNNCVGYANHRYFFMYMMYTVVGSLFLICFGVEIAYNVIWLSDEDEWTETEPLEGHPVTYNITGHIIPIVSRESRIEY